MTATPYVSVYWNDPDPMSTDKLNQMANNEQWLFENTPRVFYNASGATRSSGVKILAGMATIAASQTPNATGSVNFGTFFSTGCVPIITTGILSYPRGRITCAVRGIGTFWPDNRGFEVRIGSTEEIYANDKIDATVYINYIAIGW